MTTTVEINVKTYLEGLAKTLYELSLSDSNIHQTVHTLSKEVNSLAASMVFKDD